MRERIDRRAMAALSSGHAAVDFSSGALPALLPFLVDRFDLSYTLAAVLMLASALCRLAVQPLFGLWSDRRGADLAAAGRASAVGGIGIALAAVSPSYWLVVLFVVVSGLGTAAYHPEGSKFAAYVSGRRRASGMSLFSIGGNLGYGLGALATTPLVVALGLHGGLLLLVPALAVGAALVLRRRRTCCSFVPEPGVARRRAAARTGRARSAAPARRDRLSQPRLVRSDHVRPALGGLARPLEVVREPPARADAPRRRRSGRSPRARSPTASASAPCWLARQRRQPRR